MNWDELVDLTRNLEWESLEFKEAQDNVPANCYETVSAFANTSGGWLIFGVVENNRSHTYEIVGVRNIDGIQNEFINTAQPPYLSRQLQIERFLVQNDDRSISVLAFYIHRAQRRDRPIYLNGDIQRAYIRAGASDKRCSGNDLARFLREASEETFNGQPLELDLETCFDWQQVQWYRREYYSRRQQEDPGMSDLEMLAQELGLIDEQGVRPRPRAAAVLMFGTREVLRRLLPRPVVDFIVISALSTDEQPAERFSQRYTLECNLMEAWRTIQDRYNELVEVPFDLPPDTLQRANLPPDYRIFREAVINLLVHQDYGDQNRTATIRVYQDCTQFSNPGDAFNTREELLQPGEKEWRNPRIARLFRMIGLSEQMGSGIPAMFQDSRNLGRILPVIRNDTALKTFILIVPKDALLSDEQRSFQETLGVNLSGEQATIFALACAQETVCAIDARIVAGLPRLPSAQEILDQLERQVLIECVSRRPRPTYILAAHLRERLRGGAVAVGPVITFEQRAIIDHFEDAHWQIVQYCDDQPRTATSIAKILNMRPNTRFNQAYLYPLITAELLQVVDETQPEQRRTYTLTELGVAEKARRAIQGTQEL